MEEKQINEGELTGESEVEGQPEVEARPEVEEQLEVEARPEVEEQLEVEARPEVEEQLGVEARPEVEEQPEVEARPEVEEQPEVEGQTEEHPMNALMEDALSLRRLKRGDIVDGIIVSVTPTEVLVDVGAKSEGVIPSKELERLGREGLESLQVGETLPVYVVKPEDREGNLVLSLRRAEEENDWRQAQALYEGGEGFESQVAGFNKGGLIVRLGRLRGFVPASQLSPEHQGSSKQQPEERWARLVGMSIFVKVIELNRKRKRLILSERAALRQYRDVQKEKLLDELRVGEVCRGTVSSLSDFGAFVDLGGADGLIHLSELSWNRSDKPSDVLKVGQQVEVYVLNVDRERKRIGLSLKRLEPEPWTTVESRYYVGQLVEGTVTRLANFGAFALVSDEIEGLIHISELSNGRINHPSEVVHEGEKHVMRIIRIDPRRRRMGLSLKRVADPAYADLDWRAELAGAEASHENVEVKDSDEESGSLPEDEDQDL
jgi:small subunit ribosomal protein S1